MFLKHMAAHKRLEGTARIVELVRFLVWTSTELQERQVSSFWVILLSRIYLCCLSEQCATMLVAWLWQLGYWRLTIAINLRSNIPIGKSQYCFRGTQGCIQTPGGHSNDPRTRSFPGLDQYCRSKRLVLFVFYSCRGYACVDALGSAAMMSVT